MCLQWCQALGSRCQLDSTVAQLHQCDPQIQTEAEEAHMSLIRLQSFPLRSCSDMSSLLSLARYVRCAYSTRQHLCQKTVPICQITFPDRTPMRSSAAPLHNTRPEPGGIPQPPRGLIQANRNGTEARNPGQLRRCMHPRAAPYVCTTDAEPGAFHMEAKRRSGMPRCS